MTARGESGDADERGVEPIFIGVGTHEADGSLHVVDLGGKLRVGTRTVVDAHHGETGIGEGLAQRHVGHALHVVGKPGAAIDGNHNLVFSLARLGQVDVHAVGLQVVTGIVHVFPVGFGLWLTETSESLGLCHACDGKSKHQG